MKITREQLRLWGACFNDSKLASLVPEDGLTPLEISELDVPAESRLWVLLREEVIPAPRLKQLACGWAEAACQKPAWSDARYIAATAIARMFSSGEASEADRAAAACKAGWVAAGAASSDAAEAWSWSVSLFAARAAEAWAAARAEQIADVVKVLKVLKG